MAQRIRITKGLDIPLAGAPEPSMEEGRPMLSVAILGSDYLGLKPKMLVQEAPRAPARYDPYSEADIY